MIFLTCTITTKSNNTAARSRETMTISKAPRGKIWKIFYSYEIGGVIRECWYIIFIYLTFNIGRFLFIMAIIYIYKQCYELVDFPKVIITNFNNIMFVSRYLRIITNGMIFSHLGFILVIPQNIIRYNMLGIYCRILKY